MNELPLPRRFSFSLAHVSLAPVALRGLLLAGLPLGIVVSPHCLHCLQGGCLCQISAQLPGRQSHCRVNLTLPPLLGTSCGHVFGLLDTLLGRYRGDVSSRLECERPVGLEPRGHTLELCS